MTAYRFCFILRVPEHFVCPGALRVFTHLMDWDSESAQLSYSYDSGRDYEILQDHRIAGPGFSKFFFLISSEYGNI